MNIFNQEYTLGVVAEATGIPADTIKTWLQKDLIWNKPSKADGPGTRRMHSFYGAMEIAVAGALIASGVRDNETVFTAAKHFAQTGEGSLPESPARFPGCPFSEGLTFLALGGGYSKEICYRPGKYELAAIRHELGHPEVMILVEINPIFQRVVRGLGHDPVEVLKIAQHDLDLMEGSMR